MHPIIYSQFRTIVRELRPTGRALEVGAVLDASALLAMPELEELERVGINLTQSGSFRGTQVVRANGNCMQMFPDGAFDIVLSNATLEHDPKFWLTCQEIRRVVRKGGNS